MFGWLKKLFGKKSAPEPVPQTAPQLQELIRSVEPAPEAETESAQAAEPQEETPAPEAETESTPAADPQEETPAPEAETESTPAAEPQEETPAPEEEAGNHVTHMIGEAAEELREEFAEELLEDIDEDINEEIFEPDTEEETADAAAEDAADRADAAAAEGPDGPDAAAAPDTAAGPGDADDLDEDEEPVSPSSLETVEQLEEEVFGPEAVPETDPAAEEDIKAGPAAEEDIEAEPAAEPEKESKKKRRKRRRRLYTNRELSWLDFNERVLNEAGNPQVPLAERLSFVSIYQSNLDEFFRVRVGTFMTQMSAKEKIRENKTGMTAREQVRAIVKRTRELEKKKTAVYEQLMGELEPQGLRLISFSRLSQKENALLERYFDAHIAPFLSPMTMSARQPFPFLNNQEIYAIALLAGKNGKKRMGIVPCANRVFKRLIEIPTRPGNYILSEEMILHFLPRIFGGEEVRERSLIRLTRNADIDGLEVYDEDLDYRDVMEQLIKRRNRLSPVRLEMTREMTDKIRSLLAKKLALDENQILQVRTPLDLRFVSQLQQALAGRADLFYPRRSPRQAADIDPRRPMIDQILERDRLLSYPFESMKSFVRLLTEAAEDDRVASIRITLYRLSDPSTVVDALVEAAENGKTVEVMIELRARFDEANNIEMSHRLEDAGVRVIYGLEQYKVHSKLCLITLKDEDGAHRITQIGTGNYNEKTSRQYTDLCLMTAHPGIGEEAADVFRALLSGETVEHTEHLLVAPHCLQAPILAMMDQEIERAQAGEDAYIGAKINSLTDKVLIDKMIEASKAGVRVELIVRGICCVKPGVPGETENMRVVSVVGRFLEHSRIYRFGTGAREKTYISSADYMTRNTVRRVELAAPLYDEFIAARVRHLFDTVFADTVKGKEEQADGTYADRTAPEGTEPVNSQELFYAMAYGEVPQPGTAAAVSSEEKEEPAVADRSAEEELPEAADDVTAEPAVPAQDTESKEEL